MKKKSKQIVIWLAVIVVAIALVLFLVGRAQKPGDLTLSPNV